ncbi:hypothetical protein KHA96_04365 [Bacillus sp. FJAT-49711]|uniref:hypothetical protein n=1 Tax=Bacillus sp. FJAT-49711 TaxID=2833585 RepID=UPI001BC98120|nr:hypothetical protein [Bacillus sp. FJAT-49711]MBS4217546.1 hypothetical protein [Bacillus sp. FJAT-49711]
MIEQKYGKTLLLSLLTLLMSTISGGIGLVLWFVLKDTFITILLFNSIDKWKVPAADQFSFLILGILWLMFVFIVYHYYNKGKENGQFLPVFLLITGSQSFLLFICESIMLILDRGRGSNTFLLVCEFLIGVMLISCSFFIKAKKKNGEISAKSK